MATFPRAFPPIAPTTNTLLRPSWRGCLANADALKPRHLNVIMAWYVRVIDSRIRGNDLSMAHDTPQPDSAAPDSTTTGGYTYKPYQPNYTALGVIAGLFLLLVGVTAFLIFRENEPSEVETKTFSNDTLTFQYPSDWVVEDSAVGVLVTTRSDLTAGPMAGSLGEGDFYMVILNGGPADRFPQDLGVFVESGLANLSTQEGLTDLTISAVDSSPIRGKTAARGSVRGTVEGVQIEALLMVVESQATVFLVTAFAAPDSMDTDALFDLIGSLEPRATGQ